MRSTLYMYAWHAVTDLLFRDVSPLGAVASPLLCWLGAGALVAFLGWQSVRLITGVRSAGGPFARLAPRLRTMAEQVEGTDLDRTYDRAYVDRRPTVRLAESETADLDRLRELDEAMRAEPALRRPWIQYRKTLLIEHVPWFKEPRVFSTRRAEEFFTPAAVLGGGDLGFFSQVPSLITGLGLLLTFVAISIGLSRLHVDGQTITGIAGLINGLAGKFLTSIVGLACANAFVLLERPAVRGLLERHTEFLTLLDESFPRRTVEDLLDEARRGEGRGREMRDALAGVVKALEANQTRIQSQISTLVEGLGGVKAAGPGNREARKGPTVPSMSSSGQAAR
jgi:hypothetical protein